MTNRLTQFAIRILDILKDNEMSYRDLFQAFNANKWWFKRTPKILFWRRLLKLEAMGLLASRVLRFEIPSPKSQKAPFRIYNLSPQFYFKAIPAPKMVGQKVFVFVDLPKNHFGPVMGEVVFQEGYKVFVNHSDNEGKLFQTMRYTFQVKSAVANKKEIYGQL